MKPLKELVALQSLTLTLSTAVEHCLLAGTEQAERIAVLAESVVELANSVNLLAEQLIDQANLTDARIAFLESFLPAPRRDS